MALFIKLFGFSLVAVRLPMLLISVISLIVFYDLLRRIFKNKNVALIGVAFLSICPWHIMQSIWSIDCNMFPHFMLISVYLLYRGITQKKYFLYLSMLFFAITMYTYGVSVYIVPFFLLISAIYLLKKKCINWKQLILCIAIYLLFAFPIITMYFINFFHINTDIHLGPITIQYFENNTRTSDMLFFSESLGNTLVENIKSTARTVISGYDRLEWNATPVFGTLYPISLIFLIVAIIYMIRKRKELKKEISNENTEQDYDKRGMFFISLWLILSFVLGLVINGTNINRLNIIWYPLIIFITFGIYIAIKNKVLKYIIIAVYTALFLSFTIYFYSHYTNIIDMSGCFSRKYIDAINYASSIQDENQEIVYFNDRYDGSLDVYIEFQTKINHTNAICERDKESFIKNMNNNNIVIIHKEYIKDGKLFGEFDISTYKCKSFADYLVFGN